MAQPMTDKQKKYLESLLKKSGKKLTKEVSELTKYEASKLISYLATPHEDYDPIVTELIEGMKVNVPVFEEDPDEENLPF